MRAGLSALTVGAAVAVAVGAASFIGPPDSVDDEHPSISQPVVRSSLVCPFVDGEAAGTAEIGVLALPGVDAPEPADGGEQAPITVEALALPPDPAAEPAPSPTETPTGTPSGTAEPTAPAEAAPLATIPDRGAPVVTAVETTEGTSFAVTGRDALAPGLAAEQTLIMQSADLRGISTAACTAPRREHWFVGGSGQVGRRGRLVLTNPTDVPAVVDIELWDEAGQVDAPGTQDVGVPARSQRVFLLDALAPGSVATGVHVTTNRGRVSAALEMRETNEITPQGMTFIPAAIAPTAEVVIPGVPGNGQRTLSILAPGDTDAIVSLHVLGPDGAFSPVDQDVLTVTAGSVVEVPLDTIGADPAGIRLRSDEPITAAVRVVKTPESGLPDVAFTAAVPPLPGPAPALLSRAGRGFTSTLMISSVVDVAARATVRVLAADGSVAAEQPLEIPPGATVVVPLTPGEGMANATAVLVPEAPGTLVAAREITATGESGTLADLMPLVSPTIAVPVPEVVGELPSVPAPTDGDD